MDAFGANLGDGGNSGSIIRHGPTSKRTTRTTSGVHSFLALTPANGLERMAQDLLVKRYGRAIRTAVISTSDERHSQPSSTQQSPRPWPRSVRSASGTKPPPRSTPLDALSKDEAGSQSTTTRSQFAELSVLHRDLIALWANDV